MAAGKRAERPPAANGNGGSPAGMRQRQRIRRDVAQQGGSQHHGEEGVARAGCIKRLGGHGGAKLALALLDQPGTCGPPG